jgi:hypothetical protein
MRITPRRRRGRQHQHLGGRHSVANLARGLDAAAVEQPNVHDDHVGALARGGAHRLRGGFGLGDDMQIVRRGQHGANAAAHELVVVDQHDPHATGPEQYVRPFRPRNARHAASLGATRRLPTEANGPLRTGPIHRRAEHVRAGELTRIHRAVKRSCEAVPRGSEGELPVGKT